MWLVRISVVATTLATAGVLIYGFPPPGDPNDADLVYVIGPPTPPRIAEAQSILGESESTLLVSVASPENRHALTAARLRVCTESRAVCQHPEPFTTKGEALMLVDYARTHEVHKVAVITFTPHVARTRYIFARCAPDIDVQVIGVDEHLSIDDWVYQFAYQTTAFAKAIATPCASDDE